MIVVIKEVNTAEFKDGMPNGLTLADFYSPTCGPCKMLAFVLQDVDKNTDIQILKVNYDENPDLLAEHNVTGYPTLILFKDGVEVERKTGLQQKPAIIKMIQAHA